jgi:hypothetical protein
MRETPSPVKNRSFCPAPYIRSQESSEIFIRPYPAEIQLFTAATPQKSRPNSPGFLDLVCYFPSGSGSSSVAPDSNFLARKRRIKVKLDSRLPAQVLVGITALTHVDHADERTFSGMLGISPWSSERRRSQAPEGGVSKLKSCQAGIFIN